MRFHKEGWPSLILVLLFAAALNLTLHYFLASFTFVLWLGYLLSAFLLITILQFFRNPKRLINKKNTEVVSPCDGKVVVIEEVEEPEYFKDKRIQISIFMSPINVHVNRYPIQGIVKYVKYHPGKYLVAWHPKSSTENERSTVVVAHDNGKEVLFRQIAGALARRVVTYAKEGDSAKQGDEMGFIKFGSRVDVFLPIGTPIHVKIGDVVKGPLDTIADLS